MASGYLEKKIFSLLQFIGLEVEVYLPYSLCVYRQNVRYNHLALALQSIHQYKFQLNGM